MEDEGEAVEAVGSGEEEEGFWVGALADLAAALFPPLLWLLFTIVEGEEIRERARERGKEGNFTEP
jgi:hypothetical protein